MTPPDLRPPPPPSVTLYVVVYAFWDADPSRPAADCAGRWVPTWRVLRDRPSADRAVAEITERGHRVYAVHEIASAFADAPACGERP